jgi:hypothetical protein
MTTKSDAVKQTFIAGALLLSQTLMLTPLPVFADGDVRLAGQPVFSIPPSSTALNAETVQNNLDNALVAAKDKSPSSVSVVIAKGMPVVTLGGFQVATVDPDTAKAAGTTATILANQWAAALKGSLQDQNSINSYISQLAGSAAGAAPPAGGFAPPQQAAYAPPQAAYAPPQAYAPPGGGYPPQGEPNGGGYMQNTQYSPGGANYAQTPPPGYGGQPYGQPPMYGQQPQYGAPYGSPPGYRQGRVATAPAGLVMPLSLQTSISTQVAKTGDMIQAQISEAVQLGDATIPAGSTVVGTITDSEAGRRLSRSGALSIKFTKIRTPDGIETPISGHLIGGIDKYKMKDNGTVRGEGGMAKLGQTAIRGGAGAGLGAALGTAVGAIAGRGGYGAGQGAWSGAAIGGGIGVGDMLLRKGRDVTIPSGTRMQLQLDAPATIAGGGYTGNL